MRATLSGGRPAPKGTMIRTGFAGQPCPCAGSAAASTALVCLDIGQAEPLVVQRHAVERWVPRAPADAAAEADGEDAGDPADPADDEA